MGRAPCCDKSKVKRGPWSPEEDETLKNYVEKFGTGGNWIALPQKAGLKRCGKSCRLRWLNYLRPHIKRGGFTEEEDNIIISLYGKIGSRWSVIASNLPGRTDNDVKNHWNTKLKKKLFGGNRSSSSSSSSTKPSNNNNNHIASSIVINASDIPNNNIPINYHPSSSTTVLPSPHNNTVFPIDDHHLHFPSFYTIPAAFDNQSYLPTTNDLVFDPLHQVSSSPQEASRTVSGSPSSSSLTTMEHQNNYLPFSTMEDHDQGGLFGDLGFEFGFDQGHGNDHIGYSSCHGEDVSCFGFQNYGI